MINIGLIGYGYWGPNLARNFSEIDECKLAFLADNSENRLEAAKMRYPSLQVFQDYRDMLSKHDLNAVVIATPVSTHYTMVQESLKAKKHVLVEKPLTSSVQESEELVNIADRENKILMVGHTFLYNSGIRKMKECIDEDDFGKVYYLHATRTHLGRIRNDINVVWDLAPHDISIFDYLLGKQPLWASATGSRLWGNDREDVAFITLGYSDNIIGNIHVSWVDPNKVREVVVVGSNKRIVFDDLNTQERVKIFEKGISPSNAPRDGFGEFQLLIRDGAIVSPVVEVSEPLKNECNHFIECILEDKKPLTDGYNGLEIVRIMDAIQESLRNNGRAVVVKR
ncbi:gfo/Idh/MocA family oxidoreductase [Candidatus Poribacteria bacterium]|nr:gfo/Idh/MocA family oxidoreductase [Candidatus Poribacteria bacterium]